MNGSGGIPGGVPLRGGRDTAGVVRMGDTVRRPAKPSSPFVRDLLLHLENKGCVCVPRHLGQDRWARDVLRFIPGWVPAKFQYFEDAQVIAAAGLLRSFHEGTRGTAIAGGHETVCHHDPGPNNTVFQNNVPVAFIDFDFAAPGAVIDDLAYMAWTWCVSSKPDRGPVERQAAQVRLLTDAYGLDRRGRAELVPAMLRRQTQNIEYWAGRASRSGGIVAGPDEIRERVEWSERERKFTEDNREAFRTALEL